MSDFSFLFLVTDPKYIEDVTRKRNEKSDIYGLGMIFWEISSEKIPFENYKINSQIGQIRLILNILNGSREKVPESTPEAYSFLYTTCWNLDQEERPTLEQIIKILDNIKILSVDDIKAILSSKGENAFIPRNKILKVPLNKHINL